jgi:uncharacterized pyridoxal phosphate-dependent enzyme
MTSKPNSAAGSRLTRRNVMLTGVGTASGFLASTPGELSARESDAKPNVYERLGITRVINAAGTLTALGGSLMPKAVTDAWLDASRNFVDLYELQDRVGERIAKLIGVEAALVTTGAASAMLLATAAAVTRADPEKIRKLPDTRGLRDEVITQSSHHTCYDHQIANCGVKLIDVETRAELESAINDHTAMMFFYNLLEPDGKISREEWVEVARKHNIPTLLDAAADVPPLEALSDYVGMGFDMVAFSGGKALLGPNDTGLLLGSKKLIEAAKLNNAPRCANIGRMMKVSKENMVALWAAIERYVQTDHEAEWNEWLRRLGVIEGALHGLETVSTERFVPPIANHVPHLIVSWDEEQLKTTREEVTKQLAEGDPPIRLGRVRGTGDKGLLVSVFMLQPGETEVVAQRLAQALMDAVA